MTSENKNPGLNPLPNAPLGIVKTPLFTQQTIRVRDKADLVEVEVMGSVLTLGYEDALKISQLIRLHAKRAKAFAGDQSRHWSAMGVLEDLSKKK